MKLEYETAGQWSGNIGKQSWNHVNGTTPVGVRSYTFTYDGLARLKTATYSGVGSENYGIPNINYDRNGNITQLQRNGKTGGSFGLMDNLSYSYSGNRLTSVNDAISGEYEVDFVKRGGGGYTYHQNGALKSDENERIMNITYNTYLNLPEEITLSDGRWIRYTYDGDGSLIKTQYNTGEVWEYVDGFVFKNGQPYQYEITDGRAIFESGVWKLEFDYKDHLGNTRASFKEGSTGVVQTAKSDFDPWGVRLNGTGTVNSYQNRWELQGKEKEMTFNLNRINFGARVYNPTIGRWDNSDPAAEMYYRYSNYNYVLNNPISLTDPNGMWVNEGDRLSTNDPGDIAAFMDGIRRNGGGDDKDKNKQQKQSLPIGDIGTGLGFVGEGLWILGENKSADLYQQGFRKGIEGNYKLTGRNLSLFGNQTMTEASKPLTGLNKIGQLGKYASNLGTGLSVLSFLGFDVPAYTEGSISGIRLGYRAVGTTGSIAATSYLGGPYGAVLGVGFTGLEKAYDATAPARKEIVNSYNQFKRTLTSSWLKYK